MPLVDPAAGLTRFKIVYYGPGLAGKTTNLARIYERTDPDRRSKLISFATDTDRLLFFDREPPAGALVDGACPRVHLYTLPGPVFYERSHAMVLKGADSVVFVADSQPPRLDANVKSLDALGRHLQELGLDPDVVPITLQYNKRDLPTALPVAELDAALNSRGRPRFEAVARREAGVFETLECAWRGALARHHGRVEAPPGSWLDNDRPIPLRDDARQPVPAPHSPWRRFFDRLRGK